MIYSCQRLWDGGWRVIWLEFNFSFPRSCVGMLARPPLGIPTRERGNEGKPHLHGAFAARARLLPGGGGVGCLWESRPRDDGCLNRGWPGVGVLFCLQLPALMGRGLKGDLA